MGTRKPQLFQVSTSTRLRFPPKAGGELGAVGEITCPFGGSWDGTWGISERPAERFIEFFGLDGSGWPKRYPGAWRLGTRFAGLDGPVPGTTPRGGSRARFAGSLAGEQNPVEHPRKKNAANSRSIICVGRGRQHPTRGEERSLLNRARWLVNVQRTAGPGIAIAERWERGLPPEEVAAATWKRNRVRACGLKTIWAQCFAFFFLFESG